MITGSNLQETVSFTLPGDTENPTVWLLGIIPSDLMACITGESKGDKDISVAYKTLSVTLRGWENFDRPFESKKETMYGYEVDIVPQTLLGAIPMKAVAELYAKVLEINRVTGEERKNS